MRRFYLDREHDVSGVSGTGIVAEGVQFSDGRCVIHWTTDVSSVGSYSSIEDIVTIHGHEGSTHLFWVDEKHDVFAPIQHVHDFNTGPGSDQCACGEFFLAESCCGGGCCGD